jgi:hypothetical protein
MTTHQAGHAQETRAYTPQLGLVSTGKVTSHAKCRREILEELVNRTNSFWRSTKSCTPTTDPPVVATANGPQALQVGAAYCEQNSLD